LVVHVEHFHGEVSGYGLDARSDLCNKRCQKIITALAKGDATHLPDRPACPMPVHLVAADLR
jgi:hypothetical protein